MDKEDGECNSENFERHPYKNERDPEIIRQHRINETNVSKAKTSMRLIKEPDCIENS